MTLQLWSTIARRAFSPSAARYCARQVSSRSFTTVKDEYLVINAVGNDRTGIVSDISKIVSDAGGNVGQSQAARLGSHFSLMMLISVPRVQSEALQSALATMEGMNTSCFPTDGPDAEAVDVMHRIGYSGRFTLSGADNPGIVAKLTSVLAHHGLNISRMETSHEEAPFGGTTLFVVDGFANAPEPLPESFDADAIREELAELGETLNCDVSLEDVHDLGDVARA